MPLNDASRRSARQRTTDEVLAELTSENPRERVGAFRQWLKVSLSLVHLHVLTVLESDGPLSMSHLAEALDVSVASATGIVDRMEQRGLVERRREEDDRRVVLVHPTDAGDSVFRTIAEQRRQRLIPVLERMTDTELESFLIGLRAMHRVRAEAMAAKDCRPTSEKGHATLKHPGAASLDHATTKGGQATTKHGQATSRRGHAAAGGHS